MIKNKMITFITALFLTPVLMAQTKDFSYNVQMVPTGVVNNNFDTLYNCFCVITLNDTTNISKIRVKTGTSEGSSNVLDYAFLYDGYNGLPQKLSYSREGNKVTLKLGEFTANIYFHELMIEYTYGTFSSPVKWNSVTQ